MRSSAKQRITAPNAKMSELHAAMGICNLRHLEAEIAKRRLAAERYDAQLSGVPGLKLNRAQRGVQANYAYYPVVFDGYKYSRDEVYDRLAAEDYTYDPEKNRFE